MYGWRAKIGEVAPSFHTGSREWEQLLPDGVDLLVVTLGLRYLTPDNFDKAFELYLDAAKQLAVEADFITMGGSPVLTHKGIESTRELLKQIEETTGVRVTTDLTAVIDALNALSAKNIVLAGPYQAVRFEERKHLLESCGFKVLAMKGLEATSGMDVRAQPPYAPYQLAKQVCLEAPEADAIYLSGAGWHVTDNIDRIEKDFGKPVVGCIQSRLWVALRALHIREPIKGYGKLLGEML